MDSEMDMKTRQLKYFTALNIPSTKKHLTEEKNSQKYCKIHKYYRPLTLWNLFSDFRNLSSILIKHCVNPSSFPSRVI